MRKPRLCWIRLDRLVLSAVGRVTSEMPTIAGFRVVADTRVRAQGPVVTYARVRRYRSLSTNSQITIQYGSQAPWLMPWRITLIGDDRRGLGHSEIERVVAHCLNHKVSLVEVALDFAPNTGVDWEFVLKHCQFGKSRRRFDRGGPEQLRYGGRGSSKLVRCYWKRQVGCFRVELELHSALLRRYSVCKVHQLGNVVANLCPAHVRFVSIRWSKLEPHLARKFGGDAQRVCEEARRCAGSSLRSAARFLSREGVANVHRFLQPLRANRDIQTALRRWAEPFLRDAEVWVVGK
jgi:hypothetical protein